MNQDEVLHHIKMLETIKEELYSYIDAESVDKYYLPTLEVCKKLLEEHAEDECWIFLDFPRFARLG